VKTQKELAIQLCEDIIYIAEQEDKKNKSQAIKDNKFSQTIGESAILHHSKMLLELIKNI